MFWVQHIVTKESETVPLYMLFILATNKTHTLDPEACCSFSDISDSVFNKFSSRVKISLYNYYLDFFLIIFILVYDLQYSKTKTYFIYHWIFSWVLIFLDMQIPLCNFSIQITYNQF